MDQLHLMTVFVTVAEEQGFSAASRKLNLSPPAVTRAIATLEDNLGVKLLQRTTRYVRTTEAGQRYLDDARRILQDVELANEAVIGINAEPKGLLSVTAPVLFGQSYVMPGIVEYLDRHPETRVNAVFLDRVVSLLEEGFDVGIRIGHLPDSSMRAKKVGEVSLNWVASPDYLKRAGVPHTPEDLTNHTLIASSAGSLAHDWNFFIRERKHSLRINPRLTVTTNQAAIEASISGLGITRIISYQVASALANGSLEKVLTTYEPPPMPIHIIHREGRLSSAKVRAFIDLMAKRLLRDKTLN